MSRNDNGGAAWLLAGLGLAGVVGGGYAVAKTLRKPTAPPAPERTGDVRLSAVPAMAATPIAVPAMSVRPPAAQPSAAAAVESFAPAATGKPKPSATAPNVSALVAPFRRWNGPMVPPVPADAPRGTLTRSTWSKGGAGGVLVESPAVLLEQARAAARDPRLTLDELAGARLAASELGNGSLVELAAIVDTEVNRAAKEGRSLFDSLTRGQGFGRQGQGSKRPASTRLDPEFRHVWAARAVLVGLARGIARDATGFFAPVAMDRAHAAWKSGRGSIPTSCDALGLLELWSFDRPRLQKKGNACPFDGSKVGRDTRAWVGPIEEVDSWRLMLMAPLGVGPEHLARYVAARAVILKGRERAQKVNA